MRKVVKDGLVYYQSEILLAAGFDNFFFTRYGGLSKGTFAELNLSLRVGDEPDLVRKNLEKVKKAMSAKRLVTVHQMHRGRVLELEPEDIDPETLRNRESDGIVTGMPGIGIGVLCADCFPLILAETQKRIIAVAHCGRRGILEGVIENALQAIIKRGGKLEKIIGALGPGICGECYQVDEKVIAGYRKKFPEGGGKIWNPGQGFYLLELKQAILSVLAQSGIDRDQTEDLGLCAFQDDDFFSHRRSRGRAGRQLSAIMIK